MTYRGGEPILPDEKLLREDNLASVVEQDGRIVGACTVLDMSSTRGGATLRTAGVAGVGVVPEARASGVGGALMTEVLRHYRDAGFVLASLYPFRASYYRKFGYAYVGKRIRVTCPEYRFPRIDAPLPISMIAPEEHKKVRECYGAFARRYAGMNLRSEAMWWRQLGGDTPFAVYGAGDPIEGYVAIRLAWDFWEPQEVREVAWSTPGGYLSALSLIGSIGINKTEVAWFEPGDGPFLTEYYDYPGKASIDRPIMFRVLDVPGALSELRPEGSGEFTIAVHDDQVPENFGPWRVRFSDGSVEVAPAAAADIDLDIRPFSQAVLGEPSFSDVLERGHIRSGSASGLEAAALLLPARSAYCMDFF